MEYNTKKYINLEDILNEKQLAYLLSKTARPGAKIISYDLKPATIGIAGLLAEHLRLTLHVQEDLVKKIHLFIKTLPLNNSPKADFITQNNFNTREALIYKLFDEMDDTEDPNPWRPKTYIYNENMLVMPDLSVEGYKSYPATKYFDKNHVMVTATSVARFHAAFANYATKKTLSEGKPYDFLEEYGHLMNEPVFLDPQWSQAAAKLTNNFLKEFSTNFKMYPANLEERLIDLFFKAYSDLKDYEDTLNVIVHKDLWFNNILFRYSGDVANNAILLDYQCMRFAPPAFDMMLLLHLTTTKSFRECHESEVLRHYYSVFSKSLDDDTKRRLAALNYDLDNFLVWCEKARLFGMLYTAALFPYVLMDPVQAQKTFDDPETFVDLVEVDRSVPVIEYAKQNNIYKSKQLDISEEIVEKYILGD
ncbi:unnamed protein product [Euphydryas editha]|uniref:CHK kinase-like domain-containing protein n=1 Tax=Euphydryas editha TaxID=104508 RepID=A0AAU9UDG7_EUPED|nr:unnamed protein product [Euphydryas editha]